MNLDLTWKTLHGLSDEKIMSPAATPLAPATQFNPLRCPLDQKIPRTVVNLGFIAKQIIGKKLNRRNE